jgi:hypothetical protein
VLEWQTTQAVMVEFTFLCAETLLGAVPIIQAPQLFEVRCTVMLAVVVTGAVVTGAVVTGAVVTGAVVTGATFAVWQVVQTVLDVTPYIVCETGCAPYVHEPQLGIANALPAKNVGNANAEARTIALMVNFMMPPKKVNK